MPRYSFVLAVSLAASLSGCSDPAGLEGLVVALAPSTPDNLNITPIIVKAPTAPNVKYRYEWTTDSPDFDFGDDDGTFWGSTVGSWATLPGETWSVRVVPFLGNQYNPTVEGPAAEGVTRITDAGLDSDNDRDGWTENQGDCDDFDDDVFPGADLDGDGFPGCAFPFGGSPPLDCDDSDGQIHPERATDDDITRPLRDDDCDGIVDEDAVGAGDFVINEVMATSSAAGGEWIEVRHVVDAPRQLRGWTLSDPSGASESLDSLLLDGAGLFVLCPNPAAATALGVTCDNSDGFSPDVLGGDVLNFDVPGVGGGRLGLQSIPLAALPFSEGVAAQLDAGATASATGAEDAQLWCPATTAFGDELGTPGAGNEGCPVAR